MRFRTGLKLLGQPDVNRLFVAYLVTYTGTAMAPIAIAFGVLELTGSTSDAAIVIAAPTITSIVVLLVGGVLADRTSRQRIIIFAEVLAMFAQVFIACLFLSNTATVRALTLLMLVNGIAVALNMPAAMGLITQIVERDELQAMNALLGTARNGAVAGGAALGGILVATLGAGVPLMIDAASFGISALLVMSLTKAPDSARKSLCNSGPASWLERIYLAHLAVGHRVAVFPGGGGTGKCIWIDWPGGSSCTYAWCDRLGFYRG